MWLSAPVVPTAEEQRHADAVKVQLRAVDHLRLCVAWRQRHCPFEGCHETAELLFHDLPQLRGAAFDPAEARLPRRVCPRTSKERLQDLFAAKSPERMHQLPVLLDKHRGRLGDLLLAELEKHHLPHSWCPLCNKAQELRRKHAQFCTSKRGTCQIPLCWALRQHNDSLAGEREKEQEWRRRNARPSCCARTKSSVLAPAVLLIELFCPNVDEACVLKWNGPVGCFCVFFWFGVSILLWMLLPDGESTG